MLSALAKATPVGGSPSDRDAPLTLTLVLKRDRAHAFETYLHEVYDHRSRRFHRFLTPIQLSDQFGPSRASYDAVLAWLEGAGFKLVQGSADRMTITVRGTRALAEGALQLRIADYRLGRQTFYANDRDPALPASIASSVQAVQGLSDFAEPRPSVKKILDYYVAAFCEDPAIAKGAETAQNLIAAGDSYSVANCEGLKITQVVYHNCLSSIGIASRASAFEAALERQFYSENACGPQTVDHDQTPSPMRRAAIDGTGQTIGLVEFDNFVSSDVSDYLAFLGLPANLINNLSEVNVNGGTAAGTNQDEVLLDIDTAMTVAPGAKVVVYDAPFAGRGSSFQPIINQMIDDHVDIISNSWAYCEDQTTAADVQSIDALFQTAAAAGITVINGAGDTGSTCLDGAVNTVAVPADSPNATAVGGTSATQTQGDIYGGESWWNGTNATPPTGQGGFGVSRFFSRPPYQNGLNSLPMRSVPDVVTVADPADGVVICQASNGGCPNGLLYGGTSNAAPLWAAFVAQLNQALGHNLGALNSQLYPLANTAAFHDATSMGSDFSHVGLGSPDIDAILLKLSGQSVGAVDASMSEVGPSPLGPGFPLILPDDGATQGYVVVTLRDANGHLVSGKTVTLTGNAGANAKITPASAVSDSNGNAVFTVSDATLEAVTLTAVGDGTTLTQQATIGFIAPPAAAGSITANPTTVTANGTNTTTITVKLVDAKGNPTPGKQVGIAEGNASSIISGSTGTTDGTGTVTFTATDIVQENVTYTATDITDGNLPVPGNAVVDFTNAPSQPPCSIGLGTAATGYAVSTFASGFQFNSGNCIGPIGLAFDAQGNLLVGNYTTGVLYKFPPQGGAADPGHQVGTAPVFGGGGLTGLAFTQDGSLYATGKAGPFCADLSTIAQIDPTNATVLRSLSSPSCPTSLAVDPLSGDLFDANGSALFRLSNFASGSGTLSTYVSNIDGDGLAFASDGTLYAAVNGEVDSITGTNSQNPGTVTQLVAVPTADGIALAPNPGDPTHPTLYVNANNGSITKIDTSSMATTQIYSGGSRGDFVTVGPDGCLYATQTDRVIRVSKSDGSCLALATPNTAPALGITPTSVAPSPAQGSSLTFTATLNNVASPAGTPIFFTVAGANPHTGMVHADANGQASFTYTGFFTGNDSITASATVTINSQQTTLASGNAVVTWFAGKHVTAVSLNPSPTAGNAGITFSAAAALTDVSASPPVAVSGQTLTFTMGSESCSAVTNAQGLASCQLTPPATGFESLTASFAGNGSLAPSTTSTGFNVVEAGPPPPPTVLAALTIKPGALQFPTEVVLGTEGKTSPAQVVTLVNPKNKAQDLPITIQSLAATDSSYIASQNCLGTLQPGATCKVTLTFKPDSPGPHFAWLQIGSDAVNGDEEVALRGIGRQGAIFIEPRALNFGKVPPGSTPTRLVTLRNPNPIAMDIQSIGTSGPYAASQNCVGSLAAHGVCKVTITFNAPNTAGKAPGTLTIGDDALRSPQPVKLMGTVK